MDIRRARISGRTGRFWPLLPLLITSLAACRLLYEALFPSVLWLARPWPALPIFLALGAGAWWLWQRRPRPAGAALPLLLHTLILFPPTVDLVQSRFFFAAGLWLTAVLLLQSGEPGNPAGSARQGIALLWALLLPVYLLTMSRTVGQADTFEFQVVAPQLGIAHPTGYPLYLLLGKMWTLLIPAGSLAWRLNVGTAVFGLAAAAFLYLIARRLLRRPVPALLAAAACGLTPTFWSQAVAAEVYTLHALVVSGAVWGMMVILDWAFGRGDFLTAKIAERAKGDWPWVLLVGAIGLGMTNHLTTLFLLPAAGVLYLLVRLRSRDRNGNFLKDLLQPLPKLVLAFLLPLLLYAYLPLRWAAVNGEAMGMGRFVDWVAGGRFQDALQWGAWLRDTTRYAIVGRIFWQNWGTAGLVLIGIGVASLLWRRRRAALLLLLTWLGFTFYALNYYVPDLDVFLIGAQVVMGVWWACGAAAVWDLAVTAAARRPLAAALPPLLATLLFLPVALAAVATWPEVDRSAADGLTQWGTAVLARPLADGATILADSEKIAPLYYLQQAEGMRRDLNIMVLPDEAAYRAELDARLAAGETVYLARFLPGLEGIYHLRSSGPLTEVGTEPLRALPEEAAPADLEFGPLRLRGVAIEQEGPYAPEETAITFYWQASRPVTATLHVYVRWQGQPPLIATGQHPAHNYYPAAAWDPGEIVPDFYRLPHPISPAPQTRALQVAVAPPFTSPGNLAWQTVARLDLPPTTAWEAERPLRFYTGGFALAGATFPSRIRPQTPLPLTVTVYGRVPDGLWVQLVPVDRVREAWTIVSHRQETVSGGPMTMTAEVETDVANGRYALVVPQTAVCGWMRASASGCVLGEVAVSGVPLPPGAANFDDKIALLDVNLPQTTLVPGGQLPLTLRWQALAPIDENYTVFIQILDENDRIVGQVDAWPVQGTRPTGQWQPGDLISDPHVVQLVGELPPGQYRLIVGWYLLADLRRLPILDAAGAPVDDKAVVPELVVP